MAQDTRGRSVHDWLVGDGGSDFKGWCSYLRRVEGEAAGAALSSPPAEYAAAPEPMPQWRPRGGGPGGGRPPPFGPPRWGGRPPPPRPSPIGGLQSKESEPLVLAQEAPLPERQITEHDAADADPLQAHHMPPDLLAELAQIDGIEAVKQANSDLSTARPYIAVIVDRDKAAAAGYTEVALGGMVRAATNPASVGTVTIDETQMSIFIAAEDPPTTIAQLRDMDIPTARGVVKLSTLAEVTQAEGPTQISTIRGQRSASVTVTPNSADLGTANAQVTQALKTLSLPAGASATIGGVTADQSNAFTQLGLALLVAILVVYIIMVATFKSLLQPLLLLVSIPFAATGAIALQVITGVPLGVASMIGVLMLVGIVVTNAIVLIDLVNQYRAKGLAVREALIEGTTRRLRPILMTALATVFALVPLAMGLTGSGGGFISQPLAIVVIGGLLSSTVLTLVVLPVIYLLVEGGREKRKAKRLIKKAAKRAAKVAAATA